MEILFIRHGETEINVAGLTHVTGDIATLTPLGQEQINKTAEVCLEHHVSAVFASPESRALETAAIIAEKLGITINTIDALRERDWGEWEGKPWSEIKTVLEPMALDERYSFIPPGGESWEQMNVRLQTAVDEIMMQRNKASAVITHGGVIRALIPLLKNQPKESSFQYDPPNASVTIFTYEDGKYIEQVLLDTAYLAEQN